MRNVEKISCKILNTFLKRSLPRRPLPDLTTEVHIVTETMPLWLELKQFNSCTLQCLKKNYIKSKKNDVYLNL